MESLLYELREFVSERDWEHFHDPKNLAMLLASEAGELLAEYRWVTNAESDEHSRDPAARQRITEELADVGIALLLLCDRTGVDLEDAIRDKLRVNRRNYPTEAVRKFSGPPRKIAAA